jgi:hypothetical protein
MAVHAGDSGGRASLTRLSKWHALDELVSDKELSAADPPIYASLHVVVTQIPEDQTLYYMANPATNKKVCTCACMHN